MPEETFNVLVGALAEGELHVPRLGRVPAGENFRLIAAMNPFDAVGTARVSQAIADRMCRISIGYQDAAGERAIVERVRGRRPADRARGRADAPDARAPAGAHGRLRARRDRLVRLGRGWPRCAPTRPAPGDAHVRRRGDRRAVRPGAARRGLRADAEEIVLELIERLVPNRGAAAGKSRRPAPRAERASR